MSLFLSKNIFHANSGFIVIFLLPNTEGQGQVCVFMSTGLWVFLCACLYSISHPQEICSVGGLGS